MTETRVNSFSADAVLISFRAGEVLKNYDQGIVEAKGERLEKTRSGAGDGPRKRQENYNEEDPLDSPDREAFAQFLATPETEREFKTLTAFANYSKISRMTLWRWKKDLDVLRRANWLARANKLAGDLVARREWPSIMEAQVAAAKRGNTGAAKFLDRRAWPEDYPSNSVSSNITLVEAIKETENSGEVPEWLTGQFGAERIDPEAGPGDQHEDGESR
jgi:hypothetical protein